MGLAFLLDCVENKRELPAYNGGNSTGQSDPNGFHDSSTQGAAQALCLNLALLVGQLIVFSVLMRSKQLARVLAPRWKAKRPPRMLFGWAWEAYQKTHPRVSHGHLKRMLYLRLKNLDGAVMVRFCVLGFKFSAVGSAVCLFLVPWYADGPHGSPATSMDRYNMANLKDENDENSWCDGFWVVVASAYLLVGAFTHFALEEWRIFVEMRRAHFARLAGVDAAQGREDPDPGAAQALRSVLLERVPRWGRALDGSAVGNFFERLFPAAQSDGARSSRVHSCVVQAETGFLYARPDALLAQAGRTTLSAFRQELRARVQWGEGEEEEGHREDAPVPRNELDLSHTRTVATLVGSESDDEREQLHLEEQVQHTLHVAWRNMRQVGWLLVALVFGSGNAGDLSSGSSTAFLTFNSMADRVVAEQIVLDSSLIDWEASHAPQASDVVWPNAALPSVKVSVQSVFVSALLLVLLLCWSVPVASLQFYTSWLSKCIFAGLRDVDGWGEPLYEFLVNYLPVLALMGIQYLLPPLFDFLATSMEGLKSRSQIQRRVLQTYFKFQLATLYVTVFSGSLLSNLCLLLSSTSKALDILPRTVPKVATYFINFVMARAGLSTPMLLLFPLLNVPGCGGERPGEVKGDCAARHEPPPVRPNYAMEASNLGMVLVLGMTYSCIAPLIMPACMVFFLLAGLVYRWLFLYVYTAEFTCDGGIWYDMFNGSMVGLLLGTLSLAGCAANWCGYGSPEFGAMLVLVLVVVAIQRIFRVYYVLPSQYISLADAREMDDACRHVVSQWLRDDYYIDPVIKGHPKDSASIASKWSEAMSCSCCGRSVQAAEEEEEDDEDEDDEDGSSEVVEASRLSTTWSEGRRSADMESFLHPNLDRARTL